MSVKRRDLVGHLEKNGFGTKVVPVKRHRHLDRITANELCKQAGLQPKF
jgi:hypothetical protein